MELHRGDCLEVMRDMEPSSFDSSVTDPPYHLASIKERFGSEDSAAARFGKDGAFTRLSSGFMGSEWDTQIAFDPRTWEGVLRLLKPGAALLSFASPRTYHRIACAIEDAGFEIREQMFWGNVQGFPKGVNIGAQIDKASGRERTEVVGTSSGKGYSSQQAKNQDFGYRPYEAGLPHERADRAIYAPVTAEARRFEGHNTALKPAHEPICLARKPYDDIKAARIREATGWDHWVTRRTLFSPKDLARHTALGYEPLFEVVETDEGEGKRQLHFVVERRRSLHPGASTSVLLHHRGGTTEVESAPYRPWSTDSAVANYLVWGVGGLNIGACRVGGERRKNRGMVSLGVMHDDAWAPDSGHETEAVGRWPANIVLSHSPLCKVVGERVEAGYAINAFRDGMKPFGNGAGHDYASTMTPATTAAEWACADGCPVKAINERSGKDVARCFNQVGWDEEVDFVPLSLPIFHAKAGRGERDEGLAPGANRHPTLKPVGLLRHLARLVTPAGGVLLDPFCGAASQGVACVYEGLGYVGIDTEGEYLEWARGRIAHAMGKTGAPLAGLSLDYGALDAS